MDDKAAFGFYPQLKPKRTTQDPEAAKNAPIDFLRGRIAGTLGMPGDIEQLARDLAMLAGAPESQSFLPTTERVLPNIPLGSDTPVSRAAAGLGSLTSNPLDVVKAGKLAGKAAKAAKPELGQALEEYMFKQGLALPATVYHGSPHKFDKFDSSKIGTGEGSQAYGHGLYLAESPDVAKGYKDKLQGGVLGEKTASFLESKLSKSNPELFTTAIKPQVLDTISANAGKSPAEMSSALNRLADNFERQGFDWQLAAAPNVRELAKDKQLLSDISQNVAGSLYKVDLPDEKIAKMLDFDKALSQQKNILEALTPENMGLTLRPSVDGGFMAYLSDGKPIGLQVKGITPEVFRERWINRLKEMGDLEGGAGRAVGYLGGTVPGDLPPLVAKALRQAGISGIRYLDANSRAAGKGTSNFVVFPGEEDALTILERNQQPIKKESTRLADNPDTMMMEVEDQKFGIGGMAGKAVKSAVATRELEKQAVLRAEAAAKSAAKQALMPQYNEAVKGQTQKQNPPSFEQWKAINYPEGTQGLQNVPQKQTFKYPQEEAMRLAQQRAALPIEQGGLGLPANNTPEQRAKAMGFNTEGFHGTDAVKDFKKFKATPNDETGIKGVSFALDPKETDAYWTGRWMHEGEHGGRIIPVMVRGKAPEEYLNLFEQVIDNAKTYPKTNAGQDRMLKKALKDLDSLGIDYSQSIGGTEFSVLEPDRIRSRFAAFDPFRKTAATAAAMGVAAPDLLAEEKKAAGGAVFNTDPDMSDGGQIIQGAPFKHGGDVNLDAMYMAVNDAKFRRK